MDKYTYRVTWHEPDGEYLGLCAEFPSLSHLDESADAAFRGIRDLVGQVVEDMLSEDEVPPEPLATRAYSGKLNVRLTPELHRELAIEAAERSVSLNRLINDRLARGAAENTPGGTGGGTPSPRRGGKKRPGN